MRSPVRRDEGGYAMVALLVALAVMGVILGVVMPVWRTVVQREKEEELIFRGRQYARAIQLYQRKYAAAYPASIDVLVEQKFLRKKFKDPMTKSGEFEIIYQGTLAQRQAASMAGRGATSPGMRAGAGPAATAVPPAWVRSVRRPDARGSTAARRRHRARGQSRATSR
jgi:type II secretory pathway pseudopilin PulG